MKLKKEIKVTEKGIINLLPSNHTSNHKLHQPPAQFLQSKANQKILKKKILRIMKRPSFRGKWPHAQVLSVPSFITVTSELSPILWFIAPTTIVHRFDSLSSQRKSVASILSNTSARI